MAQELRHPSPDLHQRATLAWDRVWRHPEYREEAAECLKALPPEVQERFSALMEKYPRANAERWRWAKVNDPTPFPFPYSQRHVRRFQGWQRALWRFYERWGLCYPIPPTINDPHPIILAWLAPRPAETWGGPTTQAVDVRVDLRAPLNRILSCLREEVHNARRLFSIPRGNGETQKVSLLHSTPRGCLFRVALRLRLDATVAQAKRIVLAQRRAYGIRAGAKRERPGEEGRALKTWDRFVQGKTLAMIARALGCSVDQAWRSVKKAHELIFNEPYSGKRQAAQRGADLKAHFDTCIQCRTKLCPEGDRLLNIETGARPAFPHVR